MVGSPFTPAAQIVTSDGILLPSAKEICRGFTSLTTAPVKTLTPNFSRSFLVRSESLGDSAGNNLEPASTR